MYTFCLLSYSMLPRDWVGVKLPGKLNIVKSGSIRVDLLEGFSTFCLGK